MRKTNPRLTVKLNILSEFCKTSDSELRKSYIKDIMQDLVYIITIGMAESLCICAIEVFCLWSHTCPTMYYFEYAYRKKGIFLETYS